MRVGSLFSGVGGFDLGLERAGHAVVFQVERDAFCQRVLAARWPGVARYGDVRDVGLGPGPGRSERPEESSLCAGWAGRQSDIDLLVGGFPCQDLSVAGKRAGLSGARSGLFHEYVRIAKALTPTFGLVENVPGLLSSQAGADFAIVLEGLRECWPVVGYRILDSQHFGVPQRRRRVFLVGGPTEASVAEVLALTEGGSRDLAAGGQAGADVAASLTAGAHRPGVNDPGRRNEDDINLVIDNGLTHRYGKGTDSDASDTFIAGPLGGGNDGIGRRTEDDPNLVLAATLNSGGNDGGFRTEPGEHLVRVPRCQTCGGDVNVHDMACDGLPDPLAAGAHPPAIAFRLNITSPGMKNVYEPIDTSLALGTGGIEGPVKGQACMGVKQGSSIRRLTPLECERLQGFPDGWTCLCQPLAAYRADPDAAALACRCPDSPRYRAMGNAVTVNVLEWLGRRFPSCG